MCRNDNKEDKYDRSITARNDERVRDDRFMDPLWTQGDGRQNMNAPAGGSGRGGGDGGGSRGNGGDSIFGNTYGLSIRFLRSLGINGPLVTRVFVANLDYKVDENKLLEVFRLAGRVLYVELAKDKEGKSRGFAIVEYHHPVESVQAISMLHNQQLYDRQMTVRLDRAAEYETVEMSRAELLRKLPEGLKGIGMGLGADGTRLTDVARVISNLEANKPSVLNPISALMLAAGACRAANVVPAQLGVGGLSNLQASLASGQSSSSFARRSLSEMDNDAGFGRDSSFGGFNFSGRDFDSRFNREGNDRVSGAGGSFSGNQGQGESGSRQSTYGFRPISDTILIRNLPPNTTRQMLVDKFQDVGEVKFAVVWGIDRGMIRFVSAWDAERAVSIMNRSRIDDRTIDVCLY